jgi:acetyl-CoA carboxylase biotin carboxylase subunit
MIRRLFIANRGEIAVRILRTARRMGIDSIVGVSEADRASLPAKLADQVVLLGPSASSQSYLNVDRIVAAAVQAGADAVHPGYGFLSENSRFAREVLDAGMIFVGPSPESLDAMGDKWMARSIALAAGLPVVPGGEVADAHEARSRAADIGYPLLVKAVFGGGGRGMRRIDNVAQLDEQVALSMAEAQGAFGDPRIYLERYIARSRHVEVQILGDGKRAIHLGTRDCSIQRRFQKLLEEAPASEVPDEPHEALRRAAVRLAEHLGYSGAGTIEYLVDAETFDFYFLEMNVRIQVEHPVTEMVTGVDLIEQQLLMADGQQLALAQDQIAFHGHSIEVRINAEDWMVDFRPSPGRVTRADWPAGPGIRVDTHIEGGGMIPPFYDSLIGKVIVSAANRNAAVSRMTSALDSLELQGVATTAPMHQRILAHPRFIAGMPDTRFLEGLARG